MFPKSIAEKISNWFDSIGIPSYLYLSVIMILLFLTYDLKRIRIWSLLKKQEKRFVMAKIFAELIVILGSIIQYFFGK